MLLSAWSFGAWAQVAIISSASIWYHFRPGSAPSVTTSAVNVSPAGQPSLSPAFSSDPSKWSSRAFIESTLPKPVQPVPLFWSGEYLGESMFSIADRCAPASNSLTINMLMCHVGGFIMPQFEGISNEGIKLWDFAAEVFANYTSGTAYTLVYHPRAESVWLNIEKPILMANPFVEKIYQLHPTTCRPRCYWRCDAPDLCDGLPPCENDLMSGFGSGVTLEGFS